MPRKKGTSVEQQRKLVADLNVMLNLCRSCKDKAFFLPYPDSEAWKELKAAEQAVKRARYLLDDEGYDDDLPEGYDAW